MSAPIGPNPSRTHARTMSANLDRTLSSSASSEKGDSHPAQRVIFPMDYILPSRHILPIFVLD